MPRRHRKIAPPIPRTSPAASTSPPATNNATTFPLQRGFSTDRCNVSTVTVYPSAAATAPVSTPGDSTHRSRHRHRGRHHYRDRLGRNYGFESELCCARGAFPAVPFEQRSSSCGGRGGRRAVGLCGDMRGGVFVSREGTAREAGAGRRGMGIRVGRLLSDVWGRRRRYILIMRGCWDGVGAWDWGWMRSWALVALGRCM